MTDTQEQQTLVSVSPDAANSGASTPARRKSGGSLGTMLLPELQQLAGSLGLATAKLKKSDLVAAIQTAQSAPRGAGAASAPTVTASTGTEAASSSRPSRAGSRRATASAQRVEPSPDSVNGSSAEHTSTVEASAPPVSTTASSATTTSTVETSPAAARENGSDGQPGGSDGPRRDRQQQNRNQNQNRPPRQNQGGQNNQGGGQNSGQPQRDTNAGREQNAGRDQNAGGQNFGGGPGNNQPGNDDDEFEGGRRRGRRYRDRRGRTRDRVGGAPAAPATTSSRSSPTTTSSSRSPASSTAIEDKNTWFVRTNGYFAGSDDVYVANSYIRRFNLRRGDAVTGAIRQMKDGERREKYNPLVRLDTVNGQDPETIKNRPEFTKLTPLYPQERLRLETEPHILTSRIIDLVMPIGKGQRALIVSPPKAGKTMVLQAIANAIATNNPECHLMVVLVDERPEEVTDMQRSVKGEVIASTFDRRPQDHTMVAELSIERAKRLVEMGHDVVVLLDSITRLGRAYNLAAPASGRILSGGVDSTALYQPKRFLGAARNIENGGSLTIIATALVETGSAGDTVFFEEYKGTGNAELKLDRKIADKRVFPAVDVNQSSTRKEELLLSRDELAVTIKLRRVLGSLEQEQAINLLLDRLKKTRTNIEFLMQIAKTTPGQD